MNKIVLRLVLVAAALVCSPLIANAEAGNTCEGAYCYSYGYEQGGFLYGMSAVDTWNNWTYVTAQAYILDESDYCYAWSGWYGGWGSAWASTSAPVPDGWYYVEGWHTFYAPWSYGSGDSWSDWIPIGPVSQTPWIGSISPSTWIAGSTQYFDISGSGFGSAPSISITGDVGSFDIISHTDTSISAWVDLSYSSGGTAQVTVTSNGYNGMSFIPGPYDHSPTGQAANAQITAPPPTVRIYDSYTNQRIDGSTRTVTAGRFLDVSATAQDGTPSSYLWSLPSATLAAPWSWSVSDTSNEPVPVTGLSGTDLSWAFSQWGSGQDVGVAVAFPSGNASNSVTYNVNAPAVTTLTATQAGVAAETTCTGSSGYWAMCLDSPGGQPGISFVHNGSADGSYDLVQILNSAVIGRTDANGSRCEARTSGRDGEQPVGSQDFPSVPLDGTNPSTGAIYVRATVSESFSTYLMFTPQSQTGGTPVPVSVANWSWSGEAVRAANGNWTLTSAPGSTQTINGSPATAYPSWTGAANPGVACSPQ
jgi:hypothetical protein